MSSVPQTQFARIERLPPYVFNITTELKMAARRRAAILSSLVMLKTYGGSRAIRGNSLILENSRIVKL